MKYRKKPVVIEAIQWDGTNIFEVRELFGEFRGWTWFLEDGGYIMIRTLEGAVTASRNDWIIKGVEGEFYPCKPSIFALTYEPAE